MQSDDPVVGPSGHSRLMIVDFPRFDLGISTPIPHKSSYGNQSIALQRRESATAYCAFYV
jgi:hypothetical protein